MKYLLRISITLLTNFLATQLLLPSYVHAYGHKIGVWNLIKIKPASNKINKKPYLKNGAQINLISEQLTIWPNPPTDKKPGDLDIYCHPEILGGLEFNDRHTNDERLKPFLDKVGGIDKLDKILKKNFNFPIKKLDSAYEIGKNKDGKEPCKSIENINFYISKDMKHIFMFIYPYIYHFKGGFGYIDGSDYMD